MSIYDLLLMWLAACVFAIVGAALVVLLSDMNIRRREKQRRREATLKFFQNRSRIPGGRK